MPEKVLANNAGHKITAEFINDQEYEWYCRAMARECLEVVLKSLSLDELIRLWNEKNPAGGE